MFIARAVSAGYPIWDGDIPPMPHLEPGSKPHKAYIEIFGENRYESFKIAHGEVPRDPKIRTTKTIHHPRHDAESVYWILVVFLLSALPKDAGEVDDNLDDFSDAYWDLHKSQIGGKYDRRDQVLNLLIRAPEALLHNGLSSLSSFMIEMSEIVKPDYAYIQEKPPVAHLHEAMQRLLLIQICDMDDNPLELNTKRARVPKQNETVGVTPFPTAFPGIKRGSKRASDAKVTSGRPLKRAAVS
jgi:hypothetical protein